MKKYVVLLFVFIFVATLAPQAHAGKNEDMAKMLLQKLRSAVQTGKHAGIFTSMEPLWWNIHFEWNSKKKKTELKWSSITAVKFDRNTMKDMLESANLNAPISGLSKFPTIENYKTTCMINNKWKNRWLLFSGNYQVKELKKLGLPLFLSKSEAAFEEKIKPGDATLIYLNNAGQDLFIDVVDEDGTYKISYIGFRQECDT